MPYIYQAEIWCDSCGEKIKESLEFLHKEPPSYLMGDSDHFPQFVNSPETDFIDHCASREACLERIDLYDYGLKPEDELKGMESRYVGNIVTDSLTDIPYCLTRGIADLKEKIKEFECPNCGNEFTPYQKALHRLWIKEFSDATTGWFIELRSSRAK